MFGGGWKKWDIMLLFSPHVTVCIHQELREKSQSGRGTKLEWMAISIISAPWSEESSHFYNSTKWIVISYDTIASSWSYIKLNASDYICYSHCVKRVDLKFRGSEGIPMPCVLHTIHATGRLSVFSKVDLCTWSHSLSQKLQIAPELWEQCKLVRRSSSRGSETDEVVSCHSCSVSMAASTLFLRPVYSVATHSQRAQWKVYTVIVGQGTDQNGTSSHLTSVAQWRYELECFTWELSVKALG